MIHSVPGHFETDRMMNFSTPLGDNARRRLLNNLNAPGRNGSIEDNTEVQEYAETSSGKQPKDWKHRRKGRRFMLSYYEKDLEEARKQIREKIDNNFGENVGTHKKPSIHKVVRGDNVSSQSSMSRETQLKVSYSEDGQGAYPKPSSDASHVNNSDAALPKIPDNAYARYVQEGDRNLMLIFEPKESKSEVYCKQIGNKNVMVHLNMCSNLCQLLDPVNKGIIPLDSEGEVWLEIKRRSQVIRAEYSESDMISSSDNCDVQSTCTSGSETLLKQPFEHVDPYENSYKHSGRKSPTENTDTCSIPVYENETDGPYDIFNIQERGDSLIIKCEKLNQNGGINWENLKDSPILCHEKVLKFLTDRGNNFDVNICDWEYETESICGRFSQLQIAGMQACNIYDEVTVAQDASVTEEEEPYDSVGVGGRKEAPKFSVCDVHNGAVTDGCAENVDVFYSKPVKPEKSPSCDHINTKDTNSSNKAIIPPAMDERIKCRSKSDPDSNLGTTIRNKSKRRGFAFSESDFHFGLTLSLNETYGNGHPPTVATDTEFASSSLAVSIERQALSRLARREAGGGTLYTYVNHEVRKRETPTNEYENVGIPFQLADKVECRACCYPGPTNGGEMVPSPVDTSETETCSPADNFARLTRIPMPSVEVTDMAPHIQRTANPLRQESTNILPVVGVDGSTPTVTNKLQCPMDDNVVVKKEPLNGLKEKPPSCDVAVRRRIHSPPDDECQMSQANYVRRSDSPGSQPPRSPGPSTGPQMQTPQCPLPSLLECACPRSIYPRVDKVPAPGINGIDLQQPSSPTTCIGPASPQHCLYTERLVSQQPNTADADKSLVTEVIRRCCPSPSKLNSEGKVSTMPVSFDHPAPLRVADVPRRAGSPQSPYPTVGRRVPHGPGNVANVQSAVTNFVMRPPPLPLRSKSHEEIRPVQKNENCMNEATKAELGQVRPTPPPCFGHQKTTIAHTSNQETLQQYSWYHGHIDQTLAQQRLVGQEMGSFLVRDAQGTDPSHVYTIELLDGCGIKKMRIIKTHGKFHFNEFRTQLFDSMEELVDEIISTGLELKDPDNGRWKTLYVKPVSRTEQNSCSSTGFYVNADSPNNTTV